MEISEIPQRSELPKQETITQIFNESARLTKDGERDEFANFRIKKLNGPDGKIIDIAMIDDLNKSIDPRDPQVRIGVNTISGAIKGDAGTSYRIWCITKEEKCIEKYPDLISASESVVSKDLSRDEILDLIEKNRNKMLDDIIEEKRIKSSGKAYVSETEAQELLNLLRKIPEKNQ